MNIGETIRRLRVGKGMSQGDIEKRTGLMRCYLSRVENGHTIPSLETLAKIASALDTSVSEVVAGNSDESGSRVVLQLTEQEVHLLNRIRMYSSSLDDADKRLVLAMVKKMAGTA